MITVEQRTMDPGVTVLQVQGRITLGNSSQELEFKVEGLVKSQAKRVVFDLAGVSFVDSTGIGIIVMAAARLKESGGSLRVSGAAGPVRRTLELCRVPEIVPLFATLEEAASSFSMAAGSA